MEANFLATIGNAECPELKADEVDLVSGGYVHDGVHYQLRLGVGIQFNMKTGCWSLWDGGEEFA